MPLWEPTDIVIVTALASEYNAVLTVDNGALHGSAWRQSTYRLLPIARRVFLGKEGRPLHVLVARAPSAGRMATLKTLQPLVNDMRPGCVAMCGICAGHPDKTNLGDVIAPDRFYDYDTGKNGSTGFKADMSLYTLADGWTVALEQFSPHDHFANEDWWRNRPIPREWQGKLLLLWLRRNRLPTESERDELFCHWQAIVSEMWSRGELEPGSLTLTQEGRLRANSLAVQHGDNPDLSPAGREMPFRFHVKPIATGAAVMEDPAVWGLVSSHMRTTVGVEMEISALRDVVSAFEFERVLQAVAMKGVTDFADPGRDDQFVDYAAKVSAECLVMFLRGMLPEPLPSQTQSSHGARAATDARLAWPFPKTIAPSESSETLRLKLTALEQEQRATHAMIVALLLLVALFATLGRTVGGTLSHSSDPSQSQPDDRTTPTRWQ